MDRHRTPQLVLCSLVPLLFVAACFSRPTPAPPPTPVPAVTAAPPTATATATPKPTPTLNPNIDPLTGQAVPDAAALQHRPILVRYGNDRIARPPSGLSSADMIFEELAEGNFITRISGVYYSRLPETVGPIRSARPAVIDMMQMLDAALVYAGASIGTTQLLDQQPNPQYAHVGRGSDLFFRSSAKPAPHNLYLNLPALRQRMITEKVDTPVELRGPVFSPAAAAGSPATRIHIPYPGEAPVDYAYDPAMGAYERYVEGVPHTDALTGKQLAPANVIVVYAEHKNSDIVEDTLGNVAILIKLLGEGRVQVFRDGVMIEGNWRRDQPAQMLRYVTPDGKDIALKPGQSWVEIVPVDYQVKVE